MEKFGFNLDETWEVVRSLLDKAVEREREGMSVSDAAFRRIREAWAENKSGLLRHFPDTGRIEVSVAADVPGGALPEGFSRHTFVLAEKVLERPRFARVKALANSGFCGPRWLVELICRDLLCGRMDNPVDLAGNRVVSVRGLGSYLRVAAEENKYRDGVKASTLLGTYVRGCVLHICKVHPDQVDPALRAGGYCEYDPEELADLVADYAVTVFSQLIGVARNGNDVRLVLSVNPLDFLLCSVATTEWRSCHHYFDGEYRTGSLSYMLDGHSAIAYAYTTTVEVEGVRVPRKMWRQYVSFDLAGGGAVMGREFPSPHPAFAREVRRMAMRILASEHGVAPRWWFRRLEGDMIHSAVLDEDEDTTSDGRNRWVSVMRGDWQYNDAPTAAVRLKEVDGARAYVTTGSVWLPCLACGKDRLDRDQDSWLCPGCRPGSFYCECCDRSGFDEEDLIAVRTYHNVQLWCSFCVDQYAVVCDECNEYIDHEMAICIADDRQVCESCFRVYYRTCHLCGEVVYVDDAQRVSDEHGLVWVCDPCFEELALRCGRCGEWFIAGENAGEDEDEAGPAEDEPVLCHNCRRAAAESEAGRGTE